MAVTNLSLIVIYGFLLLILSFVDNIVMSSNLDSIEKRESQINFHVFTSITLICIGGQALIFYSIRKRNISFSIKAYTVFTCFSDPVDSLDMRQYYLIYIYHHANGLSKGLRY